MNKILVLISILLASVLIISNIPIEIPNGVFIIVGYGEASTLAILGIIIGFIAGFGTKGLLLENKKINYDDENEGVNF